MEKTTRCLLLILALEKKPEACIHTGLRARAGGIVSFICEAQVELLLS